MAAFSLERQKLSLAKVNFGKFILHSVLGLTLYQA